MLIFNLLSIAISLCSSRQLQIRSTACSRFTNDLRENYDTVERPALNHSEPLRVNLSLILQQIVDIDEKNQVLTLVVWTKFTWHDYKMVWDPKEYGGIKKLQMPPDALWKPDIILFNSADENFDARFPVNFLVNHDGMILHTPPAIIKSSCRIDITWFDEQLCFLKYGSWTYTGEELDLFIDHEGLDPPNHMMDTSYYKSTPNGEWDLIATPAFKNVQKFIDDSYVELYFVRESVDKICKGTVFLYLHIRRKAIYYGMNWIIPSILFLLSNVLGFTMPAECGEKITLQTTNLLSVTVFLGMVADVTPPTSTSVPIIAAFFSVSMVILGSSIIFTLLIINVHFRSPRTHKMSPWVRTAFLEWLPWLLLMNRPGKQFRNPKKSRRRTRDASRTHPITVQTPLIQQRQLSPGQPSPRVRRPSSMTHHLSQHSDSTATSNRQISIGSTVVGGGSNIGRFATMDQEKQALLYLEASESVSRALRNEERALMMEGLSVDPATLGLLRNTLRELSEYLRLSQQKMDEEEEEEEAKADWRFMAMSLDRACLFFYALISCVLPIWIFTATPTPDSPPMVVASVS